MIKNYIKMLTGRHNKKKDRGEPQSLKFAETDICRQQSRYISWLACSLVFTSEITSSIIPF
jgi:hypothetical protein